MKYQRPIANNVWRAAWENGDNLGISLCYDALQPTDSQPLAFYRGDEFDGYAVMTERKVGNGRVILLGSVPDAATIRRLAGLSPIAVASENIDLVEREGDRAGLIATEVENRPGTLTLPARYRDLLTGDIKSGDIALAPYEVLVLERV